MKNFREMEIKEFKNLEKSELLETVAFAKVGEIKAFLKKLGYKTSKMKKIDCIEALKEISKTEETKADNSELTFKVNIAEELAKKTESKYELEQKVSGFISYFGGNPKEIDKNKVVIDSFETVKYRLKNNKEKLEEAVKLNNAIEDVNRKLEGTGLFVKLEVGQNVKNGDINFEYGLVGNNCYVDSFDLGFNEETGKFEGLVACSLGIIPTWFEDEWLFDFNDSEDDFGGIENWREKVMLALDGGEYVELPINNVNCDIDYSKSLESIRLQTIEKVEGLKIDSESSDLITVYSENHQVGFSIGIDEIVNLFRYVNGNLNVNSIDYDLDRAVTDIEAFEECKNYVSDKIEQAKKIDFNNGIDMLEGNIAKFLEAEYTEVEKEEMEDCLDSPFDSSDNDEEDWEWEF